MSLPEIELHYRIVRQALIDGGAAADDSLHPVVEQALASLDQLKNSEPVSGPRRSAHAAEGWLRMIRLVRFFDGQWLVLFARIVIPLNRRSGKLTPMSDAEFQASVMRRRQAENSHSGPESGEDV